MTDKKSLRRAAALTMALAGALTLAGCFEVGETIEVRNDRSAVLVMDIAISAQLAALAASDKEPARFMEDCTGDSPPANPQVVKSIKSEVVQRGDMTSCVITMEIIDFAKIDQVDVPVIGEEGKKLRQAWIKVEPLNENRYRVIQDFTQPAPAAPVGDDTDASAAAAAGAKAANEMMDNLLAAMFAGRYITINLSAAHIENTNGELSDDATHVVWRLPMVAIYERSSGMPLEFHADITVKKSIWERFKDFVGLA